MRPSEGLKGEPEGTVGYLGCLYPIRQGDVGNGRRDEEGVDDGAGEGGEDGEKEGLEHPPLNPLKGHQGYEGQDGYGEGDEDGAYHLRCGLNHHLLPAPVGEPLPVPLDVLNHHDGGIHEDTEGYGQTPDTHKVYGHVEVLHQDNGEEEGEGEG